MLLEDFLSFGLALIDFFITYICVRGINDVLFMNAWTIHDLAVVHFEYHAISFATRMYVLSSLVRDRTAV